MVQAPNLPHTKPSHQPMRTANLMHTVQLMKMGTRPERLRGKFQRHFQRLGLIFATPCDRFDHLFGSINAIRGWRTSSLRMLRYLPRRQGRWPSICGGDVRHPCELQTLENF